MLITKRSLAATAASLALIAGLSLASTSPAMADTADGTPSTEATYQLDVGGQTTTLTEGETVVYPMHNVDSTTAFGASPDVVYPGNNGTLTVTASAGVYHYAIAMSVPATNFIGAFSVTDLTSGFSGGIVPELVFAGDIPTSKLRNHRYSGTLTGMAYFVGVPVSTTGPNATLYQYTDF
jgi:hypothetical protein